MQMKSRMRTRVGEINRDIVAAQHWQQILEIAVKHSQVYDSVNTSTSLHRIASKKPSEDDMQVSHLQKYTIKAGRIRPSGPLCAKFTYFYGEEFKIVLRGDTASCNAQEL